MEKRQVIKKTPNGDEKDGYEYAFSNEETKEIFTKHLKEKGEPIPESEVDVDVDAVPGEETYVHVHRKRR